MALFDGEVVEVRRHRANPARTCPRRRPGRRTGPLRRCWRRRRSGRDADPPPEPGYHPGGTGARERPRWVSRLPTGGLARGDRWKGERLTAPHSPGSQRAHQPQAGQAEAGAAIARLASTVAAATANCIDRRRRGWRGDRSEGGARSKESPPSRPQGPEGRSRVPRRPVRSAARRAPELPSRGPSGEGGAGPTWRHRWRGASRSLWPVPATRRQLRRPAAAPDRPQWDTSDGGVVVRSPVAHTPPWRHGSGAGVSSEGTNRDNRPGGAPA